MTRGITFSAFDLFHAGHVAMLSEAKGQCDYLVACIHADPSKENPDKNKPVLYRYFLIRPLNFPWILT